MDPVGGLGKTHNTSGLTCASASESLEWKQRILADSHAYI